MGDTPAGVARLEHPEGMGGDGCRSSPNPYARLSVSHCFLTGTLRRSTAMLRGGSGRTPLTTLLRRYS